MEDQAPKGVPSVSVTLVWTKPQKCCPWVGGTALGGGHRSVEWVGLGGIFKAISWAEGGQGHLHQQRLLRALNTCGEGTATTSPGRFGRVRVRGPPPSPRSHGGGLGSKQQPEGPPALAPAHSRSTAAAGGARGQADLSVPARRDRGPAWGGHLRAGLQPVEEQRMHLPQLQPQHRRRPLRPAPGEVPGHGPQQQPHRQPQVSGTGTAPRGGHGMGIAPRSEHGMGIAPRGGHGPPWCGHQRWGCRGPCCCWGTPGLWPSASS